MSTESNREERIHTIRTVIIASIGSATAAIVVSFFWRGGTPIAAAVTPVIVAIVSELLHRPTVKIASRVTSERSALSRSEPARPARSASEARLERLGGTGTAEEAPRQPPPADAVEEPTKPLPEKAGAEEPTLYSAEDRPGKRRIHPRFVIVTALIAFAIAAAAITIPELLGGESLQSGDRTTLFGGGASGEQDSESDEEDTEAPATQTDEDRTGTDGGSDGGERPRPEQRSPQTTPAPAPEDERTQPTQTETDSTSTTPR